MAFITARNFQPGMVIIERSEKGKATKTKTKRVIVNPDGCKQHVHIQIESGTDWCYDIHSRIEIESVMENEVEDAA